MRLQAPAWTTLKAMFTQRFMAQRCLECSLMVGEKFPPEVQGRLEEHRKKSRNVLTDWSVGFQLGVTIVLAMVTVFVVLSAVTH